MSGIITINTTFFDGLIGERGMDHHTDGSRPIRMRAARSLDDNARGLVLALALLERAATDDEWAMRLNQCRYLLGYLEEAWRQAGSGTHFCGFATVEGEHFGAPCSDDAKGQVAWALGAAQASPVLTAADKARARALWKAMAPSLRDFKHVRGTAYAILGAVYVPEDADLARDLAGQLAGCFDGLPDTWLWPEDELTYGLAILPYALLRAYELTADDQQLELALRVLDFVVSKSWRDGQLSPVGNRGWCKRGEEPAQFDQQPIEVAYLVWALLAASEQAKERTRRDNYLQLAHAGMRWFNGENAAGEPMINPVNGQCYDGINAPVNGGLGVINRHSGAEANILGLLTQLMWLLGRTF